MKIQPGFWWPAVVFAAFLVEAAGAAELRTAHTFGLAAGESPPHATLDDASLLVGSWKGAAFGGHFEEVWNPPSADSMIGMFKLFSDEGVEFYELMLITVEDETLSLKVKHFNADFTAWEDKADYIDFRLVDVTENALHFSGISFYRLDDDTLEAYIVMRNQEGLREERLLFERVDR